MKTKQAFTLLELLVVIVVIGVLAALAFPVLSRGRSKADVAYCLNNLKQWGTALHLHAAEHRDFLPPEGWANPPPVPKSAPHTNSWYVLLPAQLGIPWYYAMEWRTNAGIDPGRSTWICPSNPRRSNGNNLFHYCVNGLVDGSGSSDRQVRLTAIARPTSVVYMFDSKNLPAVHANQSNPGGFAHTNLHNGGANFMFLDGHVARHSAAAYWDRTTGRARTNNPDFVWMP